MRLIELNPRWVGVGESPHVIITGVRFDCPHCRIQKLAVQFTPPIDPQGWLARGVEVPPTGPVWKRTGDTFETLTLEPSIDCSTAAPLNGFQGHWHGFITQGQVT